MVYLCYESAIGGNVFPAPRHLLFIAESKTEFNINLKIAKARKGGANRFYECVTIRHDGNFHMEVKPLCCKTTSI